MKVMIISGFDYSDKNPPNYFHNSGKFFYRFVRKELKIAKKDVFVYGLRQKTQSSESLLHFIEKVAKKSKKEPLAIYYTGHGLFGSWSFSEEIEFSYEELAWIFSKRKKPLIIINDCCYSMSLVPYLKTLICKRLLISTTMKGLEAFSNSKIIKEILKFWRARKPANPKYFNGIKFVRRLIKPSRAIEVKLREGDDLDYLMYPKK
ncbi:hypothetical protein KJ671_00175 [Patescibacteria group bacterium]|nr:hypothetical protein [Patescibacteria group bacterium]